MIRQGMRLSGTPERFAGKALGYLVKLGGWVCIAGAVLLPGVSRAATPTSITACQTISSPGFYQLANALSNSGGDCIVISASNVTLNLNGNNITQTPPGGSSSTGAGIHVLATIPPPPGCTTDDTRKGHSRPEKCKPKPLENVFIEGLNNTISGFAYGIEDEGRRVTVDAFSVVGGGDGLFLNNAHGGEFINFGAESNGTGIYISGGGNNSFAAFDASFNTQYGIWIQGSDHNKVSTFSSVSNTGTLGASGGVYIGCSPTSPGDTTCSDSSKNNLVFDGDSEGNAYGIAIAPGAAGNNVANNLTQTNSTDDLFDANANCGTNIWFADFGFTNNSPSCAQ